MVVWVLSVAPAASLVLVLLFLTVGVWDIPARLRLFAVERVPTLADTRVCLQSLKG
jgi:hypothetical protein